jgi:hypothetical protein
MDSKSEHKGWRWGRGTLAVLLALLFLGIGLPNTGRVVIDNTTTPPTTHIVGRARDSLILIGMVAVPCACIVFGMFRRSTVETVGWVLLIVLAVLAFTT